MNIAKYLQKLKERFLSQRKIESDVIDDVSNDTHILLITMSLMVVAFVLWSLLGRLDVVSEAIGEVAPYSQVKTVQHLEGGIVSSILVREGDRGSANQPLMELEDISSGADFKELSLRTSSLEADQARLSAEINGGDIVFADGFEEKSLTLAKQARELFNARKTRLQNDIEGSDAVLKDEVVIYSAHYDYV